MVDDQHFSLASDPNLATGQLKASKGTRTTTQPSERMSSSFPDFMPAQHKGDPPPLPMTATEHYKVSPNMVQSPQPFGSSMTTNIESSLLPRNPIHSSHTKHSLEKQSLPVVQIQRAPAIRRKPGRTAPIQTNLLYPPNPTPLVNDFESSSKLLHDQAKMVSTPITHVSPLSYPSPASRAPNSRSVSDSACITTPANRKSPARHNVSIDVTEFISFAVYKLWSRVPGGQKQQRQQVRRIHTVNTAAAQSEENSPRGTVYSRKPSPTESGQQQHSPPSISTAVRSERCASAQELSHPAAEIDYVYSQTQSPSMDMEVDPPQQERQSQVPAPFDSLVCPAGTQHWYPQYVESVHYLLSESGVSMPHILIALLYVARLRKNTIQTAGQQQASLGGVEYRILLVALILAQKFHSDDRYKNSVWAKIAGITVMDLEVMEREFLGEIKWHLHVRDTEYAKWSQTIQFLGQEHTLVLKATMMHESELSKLKSRINRPDLVEEIEQIRRARTLPRHLG